MDEDRKEWSNKEIIKLSAIIIVMLAMLLYSIFSGKVEIKKKKNNMKNVDVKELFEPIKDNYELEIYKTIGDDTEKIDYITDGTFKLYNLNDEEKGYLIYEGKTYSVESNGFKIKEIKKDPSFISDNYSNIDFIKSILIYCKSTKDDNKKVTCNMELSDFINGYNNYYYRNYVYDGEDIITFEFQHGDIINTITVDYSKANKIIKNSDNNIEYIIKVKNVNSNDYSNLFEVFKNTLKK